MSIYIASDHAGYQLKQEIIENYSEFIDLGTNSNNSVDYPDYAKKIANKILEDKINSKGILICGTGIGMSISANRFKGIRAALCHCSEFAELSRKHNNANILVLPGRYINLNEALNCVKLFLNTQFSLGRHQNRLNKIDC